MSSSIIPLYTSKCPTGQYKMPFWSAMDTYAEHAEMQQDYYEVEIYTDRNYEELPQMDKVLNMTTFKCHVCNIDVPKTSAKNHIRSIKHETCLKITQIALERTNLHMKAEVIEVSQVEVKDTYFCDHCALVVQNSDKDNHDRSNRHVNSVKNDKLLQELVNIYENPLLDCEPTTIIKMTENDFDQILRKLMDPIADVTEILRDIEINESLAMNTSNIEIKQHDKKENEDTSKIVPKSKKKKSKKKLINEMQSNYTETIIMTKEDKYIENDIQESKADINKSKNNKDDPNKITSEEKTDNLNIVQQHEQRDVVNDKTHDALNASNNNMTDVGNEETSKVLKTKYKKSNKTKPVNGLQVDIKELVTETKENINNEMEMKETVLSKESIQITENPNKNITSQGDSKNSHIVQEKEGPIYKGKDSFIEQKYFLNVISKRFNKSATVTALSEDVVEIVANDGKKFRIPQLNFHGYRVTENNVVCRICPEWHWQPNHKWKEMHKTKIMAPLDKHCVRKVSDTLSHCILCNRLLLQFEIAVHVTSTEHNDNLQKYAVPQTGNQDNAAVQNDISKKTIKIAVKNQLTSMDDGAAMFCNICAIIIEKNKDCILKHVHSDTHIETLHLFLVINRIKKKNDEYYCVICEKGIWGCFLLAHCKLKKHMKILNIMEKNEDEIL